MSPYKPKIAIIGAGPAGLTLGVLLHNRGIPFTIYELRERPTDEEFAQASGMLDLHEESGLAAIRACGLWDRFTPLATECEQSTIIANKDGDILHTDDGRFENRPEISRNALEKLLLSQIPPASIRWGSKIAAPSRGAADSLVLDVGPSGTPEYDLVIGADGAWSKVRPLLTEERPHYAGTHYITLTVTNMSTKYPRLSDLVGKGTCFALGTNNGIITQRGAKDSMRLYIFVSSSDPTFDLTGKPVADIKDRLLQDPKLLGAWGPRLKELVAVACDDEDSATVYPPQVKPLFMLPVGHKWPGKTNATLIGDAAHLMPPFAAEGVNLAMWDALDLSNTIAKTLDQPIEDGQGFRNILAPLLGEFEREMFERAEIKAQETVRNGKAMFADDAAVSMAQMFKSF